MSATDTENFLIDPAPRPAYRLSDLPASYAEAHRDADAPEPVKAQGCTCRPSVTRDAARRVGLPWQFGSSDCPVHGMEA